MPFIRQKIGKTRTSCKKFVRKLKKKSKVLANDPIFYFGVFSVIFLSGILFSFPEITIKSRSEWDFSFFREGNLLKASVQDFFIESEEAAISKDSSQMVFLQQNTAIGMVPPVVGSGQVLGSLVGEEEEQKKSITEYTVEAGDTLSSIAEKSGISLSSLLWANDLSRGSSVKAGQKLVISPVSGVIYHVKKDDTLSQIASKYKGSIEEIVAFNELSGENDIYIGDILVIPNGQMPVVSQPTYATTVPQQVPIASSYFICPQSDCRITQGLHWYNAIDFDGDCGTPIVAAAGGVVQRVKYGWNKGAGNYMAILHPNGVVTTYGHITANLANPGDQVLQGQIIALVGGKPGTPGSGISTGCHVHFAVVGARNPFGR